MPSPATSLISHFLTSACMFALLLSGAVSQDPDRSQPIPLQCDHSDRILRSERSTETSTGHTHPSKRYVQYFAYSISRTLHVLLRLRIATDTLSETILSCHVTVYLTTIPRPVGQPLHPPQGLKPSCSLTKTQTALKTLIRL